MINEFNHSTRDELRLLLGLAVLQAFYLNCHIRTSRVPARNNCYNETNQIIKNEKSRAKMTWINGF